MFLLIKVEQTRILRLQFKSELLIFNEDIVEY